MMMMQFAVTVVNAFDFHIRMSFFAAQTPDKFIPMGGGGGRPLRPPLDPPLMMASCVNFGDTI